MFSDPPDETAPPLRVTKASVITTEDGRIDLELTAEPLAGGDVPDELSVEVALHDDVDVHWWATVNCRRHDRLWRGRFPSDASSTQRLIEVVRVTTADGKRADISTDRLFIEPLGSGSWKTGEPAEEERTRLSDARQKLFEQPLVAATGADVEEFMVVMLADNLYLTREQRVSGVRVLPLTRATLGADQAEVLNAVLVQLGFRTGLSPSDWVANMARQRPAAILVAPRVVAESPEQAHLEARRVAHHLLDLLALRRGATSRLLSGVVGDRAYDGTLRSTASWIEGPGYTGNVLGGFISGEDLHSLVAEWAGLRAEPRARLWLSLYADALADERWDYRLFRFFNLLEGIGAEVLPEGQTVRDPGGQVLFQDNGKPYTTSNARSRVYSLLRRVAALGSESEANYTAPRTAGSPPTLWDEAAVWVAVRNAVAHRGSWSLPDGQIPSRRHAELEADIASRGHDGTLDAGIQGLVRGIRSGVEATLRAALHQSL